jgi:hypothetical protein
MISVFSDPEMFMMDEEDYDEHLLLNALQDDVQKQNRNHHHHHHHHHPSITSERPCLSTHISDTSSTGMGDEDLDDLGFFDDETVGIVNSAGSNTDGSPFELTMMKSPAATAVIPEHKKRQHDMDVEETEGRGSGEPTRVGVPAKFDILCGQSRICAGHTGNRRFQVVLDIYAPRYDASSSKQEKMTLTKEIVGCIHAAGGRFLKYREGQWEEISNVTARDKVSHALRTKVTSWKRQVQDQETEEVPKSGSSTARPAHHRKGGKRGSSRSSGSSITTSASDIATSSFDGSDAASACVMGELLKAQREIFATLTTPETEGGNPYPLKK